MPPRLTRVDPPPVRPLAWAEPRTVVHAYAPQVSYGQGVAPAGQTPRTTTPDPTASLFSAVGGLLGTTGATIASVINSNEQVEIARLQAQTETQVATLLARMRAANAAGDYASAGRYADQQAQLEQFRALLANRNQTRDNTTLYVVGGLLALGLIGTVVYLAVRKR